jgi:hypothetical protein
MMNKCVTTVANTAEVNLVAQSKVVRSQGVVCRIQKSNRSNEKLLESEAQKHATVLTRDVLTVL